MILSTKQKRRLAYRHWETWAGLCLCAGCAGLGGWLGQASSHPSLGAAVGGALGGWLFSRSRIAKQVARRYDAGPADPS